MKANGCFIRLKNGKRERRCSAFVQTFVRRKVEGWVREVEKLSKFAETQPHSAYAAFTHGLMSKWNYLLRVVDWDTLSSAELLQPLESAIQSRFIPAITGQAPPGKHVRALPVRLGGLGLRNPTNMAKEPHTASQQISAPLVDRVVNQQHRLGECHVVKKQTKVRIRHHKRMQQDVEARNLQTQLPSTLQRMRCVKSQPPYSRKFVMG